MYMGVSAAFVQVSAEPEEGVRSPGAGATGSCEGAEK